MSMSPTPLSLLATLILVAMPAPAQPDAPVELYTRACASCHGADGRGREPAQVAFAAQVPDFTDCEFASREPDPDWYAVIHQGGPVRAFDRMMPAFGEALTGDEMRSILLHVRTFCDDPRWPRGEFNLPRPLFTEKAFPEDEVVLTVAGDESATELELLYEKRFGPRGMVEVAIPAVSVESAGGDRETGGGDIALGYKHTVYSDLRSGNIFSLGGEVILPTGDDERDLGKGTTVLEPFVTWGKLFGGDTFLQAHAFAEFPTRSDFDDELGLRMALGRTWASAGGFGRSWTPMLEVLAVRDLTSGAATRVDLVPQMQVSLSERQHVLLNLGVTVPVVETARRDAQVVVYLLWDWFDGGFFDGW